MRIRESTWNKHKFLKEIYQNVKYVLDTINFECQNTKNKQNNFIVNV